MSFAQKHEQNVVRMWYMLTSGSSRGAEFTASRRRDLLLRLERTTGFEPATLTLAIGIGALDLPAAFQKEAAPSAFSIDSNGPQPP
jgi:hypothetical protein